MNYIVHSLIVGSCLLTVNPVIAQHERLPSPWIYVGESDHGHSYYALLQASPNITQRIAIVRAYFGNSLDTTYRAIFSCSAYAVKILEINGRTVSNPNAQTFGADSMFQAVQSTVCRYR